MSRRNLPGLGINPESPTALTSSTPMHRTLSFVNINNPREAKNREQRKAVRSHVAYYQHHKDDNGDPRNLKKVLGKKGSERQRQSTTFVVQPRTFNSGVDGSRRHSERGRVNRNSQNASSESSAVGLFFRGAPIDPFQSYPVSHDRVPNHLCLISAQTPSLVIHS